MAVKGVMDTDMDISVAANHFSGQASNLSHRYNTV